MQLRRNPAFICFEPRTALLALLFWGFIACLYPAREVAIGGLSGLAATFAYLQWHTKDHATRMFLFTRPGWKRLFFHSLWFSYVMLAICYVVIYGGKVIANTLFLMQSSFFDEMTQNLVTSSWHWNLYPYLFVLYTGCALFFSRSRPLGVLVMVFAAFIPSVPSIYSAPWDFTLHGIQVEEVFLWNSAGYWKWIIPAVVAVAVVLWMLAKRFKWKPVGSGRSIEWLLNGAVGKSSWTALLFLVICFIWMGMLFTTGWFFVAYFFRFLPDPVRYITSPFFISLTGVLGPLWLWSLLQFKGAVTAVENEPFYLTRPCRTGRGPAAAMRGIFAGAYIRTMLMALLAACLFTWNDLAGHIFSDLPFELVAARIAGTLSVVSLAFLSLAGTWWMVRREGERLFSCYLIHFLVLFGSYSVIWYTNLGGVPMYLGIVTALNLLLAAGIWFGAGRPPVYTTNIFRVAWLGFLIIWNVFLFRLVAKETCIQYAEVLLYTALHGGYPLLIWIGVAAFSVLFTFREGRKTGRRRSALVFFTAVSVLIPFLGYWLLYMTRSRRCWLRHYDRWGIVPRVFLPCLAVYLFLLLHGEMWRFEVLSEAYVHGPSRLASRVFYPGDPEEEPVYIFDSTPRPAWMMLDKKKFHLPLILSKREAETKWSFLFTLKPRDGSSHPNLASLRYPPTDKELHFPELFHEYGYHFSIRQPKGQEIGPGHTYGWGGSTRDMVHPLDKIAGILAQEPDNGRAVEKLYREFGSNTVFFFDKYILKRHSRPLDLWELLQTNSLLSKLPFCDRTMQRFTGLMEEIMHAEGFALPSVNNLPHPQFRKIFYPTRWKEPVNARIILRLRYFYLKAREDPGSFLAAFQTELEKQYVFERPWIYAYYPLDCIARLDLDLDAYRIDKEAFLSLVFDSVGSNFSSPYEHCAYYLFRQMDTQLRNRMKEYMFENYRISERSYSPPFIFPLYEPPLPELASCGTERFRTLIAESLSRLLPEIKYNGYSPSFEIIEQRKYKYRLGGTPRHASLQRFWGLAAALCWPDASILDTVAAHWEKILNPDLSQLQRSRDLIIDYGKKVRRFVEAAQRKWPDDPRPKKWRSDVRRKWSE